MYSVSPCAGTCYALNDGVQCQFYHPLFLIMPLLYVTMHLVARLAEGSPKKTIDREEASGLKIFPSPFFKGEFLKKKKK